jgi:alkylhydroperoxidase family enzyme
MLAFTDSQVRAVWAAANRIAVEKRRVFLDRVIARLQRQRGFTDDDLDDAVRAALIGLIPSAA